MEKYKNNLFSNSYEMWRNCGRSHIGIRLWRKVNLYEKQVSALLPTTTAKVHRAEKETLKEKKKNEAVDATPKKKTWMDGVNAEFYTFPVFTLQTRATEH